MYVICFASCLLQGNCSIWVFGKLLWVGFLWPSRPCIVVLISMLVWYLGMLPWVSCWISVRVLWSIFSCGNEIPWIIHPKKKKKRKKEIHFFGSMTSKQKVQNITFFFFVWIIWQFQLGIRKCNKGKSGKITIYWVNYLMSITNIIITYKN